MIEPSDPSNHVNSNMAFVDVENASRLTPLELHCNVYFYANGGFATMFQLGFDPYSPLDAPIPWIAESHLLTTTILQDIRSVHDQLQVVANRHEFLSRALAMFRHVCAMPRSYDLTILGFFAVIEAILTHDPRGEYDSLGHQIKTKIPLLDRRMSAPIDYSVFSSAAIGTLWSKLYTCRSRIAHGGHLEFRGDLQSLGDAHRVAKFLRSATKSLLRHALIEPELIKDLRLC